MFRNIKGDGAGVAIRFPYLQPCLLPSVVLDIGGTVPHAMGGVLSSRRIARISAKIVSQCFTMHEKRGFAHGLAPVFYRASPFFFEFVTDDNVFSTESYYIFGLIINNIAAKLQQNV